VGPDAAGAAHAGAPVLVVAGRDGGALDAALAFLGGGAPGGPPH
jgi:glutamate synthase domain-containing protein 2